TPPDPAARIPFQEVRVRRSVAGIGGEERDGPLFALPAQQRKGAGPAVGNPDVLAGKREGTDRRHRLIRREPVPSILVVEPCDPRRIADPQAARGVHLQLDGLRVLSLSNLREILVPEVQRTGPAFDPEQCALGSDPQPALTVPPHPSVLVRRQPWV